MNTFQLFKSNLRDGEKPSKQVIDNALHFVASNGARLTVSRDRYNAFLRASLNLPLNRRIVVIEYFQP